MKFIRKPAYDLGLVLFPSCVYLAVLFAVIIVSDYNLSDPDAKKDEKNQSLMVALSYTSIIILALFVVDNIL